MRIVILGAPGSGKGTQAAALSAALAVPAISTGDMLRASIAQGSELGERVKGILASGDLVDDETMAEVVGKRLLKEDARQGFVLDGYPRNHSQAQTLEDLLGKMEVDLDAVLLVMVPQEELVRRLMKRGRVDDEEEVVRKRLVLYREKTEPLINFYRESGRLVSVAGDQGVEQVTASILEAVGAVV